MHQSRTFPSRSRPVSDLTERIRAAIAGRGTWLLLILGLSLLIRVVAALIIARVDPFLQRDPLLGDAASYDRIARTLLMSGVFGEEVDRPSAFWPPAYPLFLAAIYGLFGYNLTLARVIQAIVAAILPVAVYATATEVVEERTARLAGIGMALYPPIIYFGTWLIAESLYFALLGLLLWLGVRLQHRPSPWTALQLGAVIGLAVLTKPTHLIHLPFLGLWFLCCITAPAWRRRFLLGAISFGVALLVMLPWTVRNYQLLGAPVLVSTNGGYTFFGANNAAAFGGHYEGFPSRLVGMNEAEEQAEFYRRGLSWITAQPDRFAWLVAQKFRRLLSPLSIASDEQDLQVPGDWLIHSLYGLFLGLASYGLIVSLARWRAFFLFSVPILGVASSTLLFYGDLRYTLPAVPSLVLFATMGTHQAVTQLQRWRRRPRAEPA